MVPGTTIEKDPVVTLAGTERAYVFVEVNASEKLTDYIEYGIDSAWTKLTGVDGVDNVYYKKDVTPGTSLDVLAKRDVNGVQKQAVKVKDSVNNKLMEDAKENEPTLTFKAYAIQAENIATPVDAWNAIVAAK